MPDRKYLIIIGVVIVVFIAILIIFFLFRSQPVPVAPPPPTPSSPPVSQSAEGPIAQLLRERREGRSKSQAGDLSLLYSLKSFSPQKGQYEPDIYYISDIANKTKTTFPSPNYPTHISPNRTYFAQVRSDFIKLSKITDVLTASYQTIVAVPQRPPHLDLDTIFWSPAEDRIVYEVRILDTAIDPVTSVRSIYSEAQYYEAGIDGKGNTLVGSIVDYPGGKFHGYDFDKKILYISKNDIPTDTQSFMKLITSDNKRQEIFSASSSASIFTTKNFVKAYYFSDLETISQVNLENGEKSTLLNLKELSQGKTFTNVRMMLSKDNSFMIIGLLVDDGSTYKYILDLLTNAVDTSLMEEQYIPYAFHRFHPISPDGRYIFLLTNKKDIPQTSPDSAKGFYSGRYCIWDRVTHTLLPFFNCPVNETGEHKDLQNQDIVFMGWQE